MPADPLQLPATQNYTFHMACDDHCTLFIDGTRIMQAKYAEPNEVTLQLGAGQRHFTVGVRLVSFFPVWI